MAILYKYYNFYSEKLYVKPKLKLTPPSHLNDPFEKKIPHGIEDIIFTSALAPLICNSLNKAGIHDHNENTRKTLEKILNHTGITSMTETFDNILMWSHYANDHKGICIGYDTDKVYNTNMQLLHVTPSDDRFTLDGINHDDHLQKMIQAIIRKVVTTKSNMWAYEKEYRYITKLAYSDEISITVDNDSQMMNELYEILNCTNGKIYLKAHVEDIPEKKQKIFTIKTKAPIDESLIDNFMQLEGIQFYNKINQESITSIYIGCESSINVDDVSSTLRENNMQHVNVKKLRLSDTKFELEIIE